MSTPRPVRPASLEAAWGALGADQLGPAETACLEVLHADAANAEALHLLGLVRLRSGRPDDAVKLLQRAVQTAPHRVTACNDLGATLIILRRPLEAIAVLRAAAAVEPANAELQVNLGNALHAQGDLEAAERVYRLALQLDPRHVRGCVSLGNLLCQLRRPPEAIEFLGTAATLAPDWAVAHQFLGNALRDVGRLDEAVASYQRAIALDPKTPEANESLGLLLMSLDRLEPAISFLEAATTHHARANALQCLLRLGRYDEFFSEIRDHQLEESTNLHSASLSAYAAYHLGRPDPHPFCPSPLERVKVLNRYNRTGPDADFLRELISEASQLTAVWEPRGVTTKGGYQTGGNIFAHGLPALERLRLDILGDMERYRASIMPANMTMVTRWPVNGRLHGWFVRLLTGGHQDYHNHPDGWATGCLYLKMPEAALANEGAIEFGLESSSYPRLSDKPPPTLVHNPKPGQVAFFPSSLYHRTIPFSSNQERMSIAFDLLPA